MKNGAENIMQFIVSFFLRWFSIIKNNNKIITSIRNNKNNNKILKYLGRHNLTSLINIMKANKLVETR